MKIVTRAVREVTFDEADTIYQALGEWLSYLKSVDLNRQDIDPKQVKENIKQTQKLLEKWVSIRCELEDLDIESGRWPKVKVDRIFKSSYTV